MKLGNESIKVLFLETYFESSKSLKCISKTKFSSNIKFSIFDINFEKNCNESIKILFWNVCINSMKYLNQRFQHRIFIFTDCETNQVPYSGTYLLESFINEKYSNMNLFKCKLWINLWPYQKNFRKSVLEWLLFLSRYCLQSRFFNYNLLLLVSLKYL